MTPGFRGFLALMLAGGVPVAGYGQSEAHPDGLQIPERIFLCRRLPATTPDSGLRSFQVFEGRLGEPVPGREMIVIADSLGQVVALSVLSAGSDTPGGGPPFGLFAQLGVEAQGFRVVDTAAGSSRPGRPDPPPRKESLDQPALARARLLAQWLWEHRCGTPPGPSSRVHGGQRHVQGIPRTKEYAAMPRNEAR